jgi:holo-[acyl-carrier protein] synthase
MVTGIDIIEISQIKRLIDLYGNKFLSRVFTTKEISYCETQFRSEQHLAVRLAAKEAVMKALGCGWNNGVQWKQIEIVKNTLGQPVVLLSGETLKIYNAKGYLNCAVSMSHSKSYAIASVVMH